MQLMGLRLGELGEVYLRNAGKLSWAAKGLATTGAALLALRGRESRTAAALGGTLVCAGEGAFAGPSSTGASSRRATRSTWLSHDGAGSSTGERSPSSASGRLGA